MTNPMDEELEQAFNDFGLLDEDRKAEFAAEKIATQAMIYQLETRYADRDLKFVIPFCGAVPVQAYGHIDGQRFYFRFRGNWGSLRVGPYLRELEELWALRVNEDNDIREAESRAKLDSGEMTQEDFDRWNMWSSGPKKIIDEDSRDFIPHLITKAAGCEGQTPGDDYNGDLDNEEAHDMFIKLVDSLEDVPEDEQLDEGTRIWLYEGRAARNIYDEKWKAEWWEAHKHEYPDSANPN